jgi:KDO2-lipid IV(A) lauroyltransferase
LQHLPTASGERAATAAERLGAGRRAGRAPRLEETGPRGKARLVGVMAARPRRQRHDALFYPIKALFDLGCHLPLGLLRALGASLGRLALPLSRREWRRAGQHLEIAFPELDSARRRRLLRCCAAHLGRTLGEVVWLRRATAEQVAAVCSLSGLEHLERALDGGHGAIIITGHCGNWELLNARVGVATVPMSIAVRELSDPRLDELVTALRSRFGVEVVARGANAGRRLLHALARNRVAGLLIDQDIHDIPGVFVPFFGRPAWTPSGAATLALRVGSPIVPVFIHRRPDGTHLGEIRPPLPAPTTGSDQERVLELTAAATMTIEHQIRAHPEQWVWMHRRWRTRPKGEG